MMAPDHRAAIAALGTELGPETLAAVQALYHGEQSAFVAAQPAKAVDCAYGPHPRHKLDLYAPAGDGSYPILLWVHGGGFVRGEKASPDQPYNAHVGRWAARHGLLGAVMNYRLLPEARWPSGGEDVAAAISWLRAYGAAHHGDPTRIIVMGTSAGAVHVATALQRGLIGEGVRGAVLLSGLYGATPPSARDADYFGDGPALDVAAVAATTIPLLLACAEFDPDRFQAETLALATAIRDAQGRLPQLLVVGGHNHFSLASHLGGSDRRLSDAILAFLGAITA